MEQSEKINFANSLRGVAALSVLVSHYFGVFWINRDGVGTLIGAPALSAELAATPHFILWMQSVPIFESGAYGVALFFLVSGFVIPFLLAKTDRAGFLVNRALRIYPTYFAGFSISLALLWVSSKYFATPWGGYGERNFDTLRSRLARCHVVQAY